MHSKRSLLLLATIGLLALAPSGFAQHRPAANWPGLWGPGRDGMAPVTATAPRGVKQMWRRPVAGGYSEIVIADDRVYTMEMREGVDYVVAMDARTGSEHWRSSIGPTYRGHEGSHDGPISTPAVQGSDVFALGPNGHLVGLDARTGKELWRHDLVKEFNAVAPAYGFASSPLIEGQLVYVPTGGEKSPGLLALDRRTGKLVWSAAPGQNASYSSPIAGTVAGTRQVISAAGDRIFAVTPDTGRILWSVKGPGSGESVANPPIVLPDDRVLLTFWTEAVMLKVARDGDAFSTSEVWRSSRLRSSYSPTIFRDGFLYGFSGPFLLCMEAASGDIRWRHRLYEGTLVGMGQHLLVLSRGSGNLHVVDATPTGFSEVFQAAVLTPGATSITGPSAAGDRVFLRNVEEIAAFTFEGGR
jgi:outer membrane protein assembly factor BamB